MSSNPSSPQRQFGRFSLLTVIIGLLLCSTLVLAQTTVGTGSIVGTVTDQSGAVVGGAKVSVIQTPLQVRQSI